MAKRVANKPIDDSLRQDLEGHLETLVAKAGTEGVRKKLRNLHRACACIVEESADALTVPLVVETYAKICKGEIGESTIRNKRGGENLYQSLYRKWEIVAAAKAASSKPSNVLDAGIIGDHEIMTIENPRLRHQVILMLNHNRSLHSQLNILRHEQAQIPLRIEGSPLAPGNSDLLLSDDEVEAVRDFVDARRMNAKNLQRTKDDGVKLKDGRPIADPGFVSALEKIVRSYERQ
ncbi:hypothetical protein JQ607_16230 [Bradyrhizobium liaoningense]|uniref:gamma-mobile-trio protein GmtX n=1 Tax=Bradyrhizobium liaoningense TaxID=43992 RepID=UPI001BAD5841|nr:gamma-mobile-trio protein GmtX [Bradyrhizobium liaoningense]MBR0841746.1 hypothetical protein [Bradyrhizobium liaoningense]